MFYSRKGKTGARIVAFLMTLIMCFSFVPVSFAEEEQVEARSVSIDDVKSSIDSVIKSVGELQEIMGPGEQSAFMSIFNTVKTYAGQVGTVFALINGTNTFLKLIGVLSDDTAEGIADIRRQLITINEKLSAMDAKLDEISEAMAKMQATTEYNKRGERASQMLSEWYKFQHDYMEDKMDELMNEYDAKMLNITKDWIEYKKEDARQTGDDELNTNKAVIYYQAQLRPLGEGEEEVEGHPLIVNVFTPVLYNYILPDTASTDVDKIDPYTMYADDPSFNDKFDQFLILDDTFLPQKGDVAWNVNTYRSSIKEFIKRKLTDLWEDSKDGEYDSSHITVHNLPVEEWTEEDVDKYADDAVDAVLHRLNYLAVNDSAEFSKKVQKEFGEFCDHLDNTQQGIDSMLKTIYLTHAFEYEVAEDIKSFCNQMMLRTGVYSMFALNIMGLSSFITDDQKMQTAVSMVDAINTIQGSLNNGLTGDGGYCYVTNSLLSYSDVTLSGNVDLKYYIRGAVSGYQGWNANPMKITYQSDAPVGSNPTYVGDANALVIAYLLRDSGQVMDHDYLNERFSGTKRTKKRAMITSLKGEQTLAVDAGIKMKSHNLIGGYFHDDPELYLNGLPAKADLEDLVYRHTIIGSTVDGPTFGLKQNVSLIGTAGYGESHWNWEVDESAALGGPCDDPTFKDSLQIDLIDDGIFTNTYMAHYNNSVQYNCLLQVPNNSFGFGSGPFPLEDLKNYMMDVQLRSELEEMISDAENATVMKGWSKENIAIYKELIAFAKELLNNEKASVEELARARDQLIKARDDFNAAAKKDQKLKVSVKSKTLKAKALKKSKKTVKAVTVKGYKGKLSFKKVSVTKKKFAKKFTVNKKSGKITVKKGLKKGTYKIKIKVSASGNGMFLPASKTVTVKIKVK